MEEKGTYSGRRGSPDSLHRHCCCYRCRETILIGMDGKIVRSVNDF